MNGRCLALPFLPSIRRARRRPTVTGWRGGAWHLLALGALLFPVQAQDRAHLTVDRLHLTDDFAAESPGPIRWIDGGGYAKLEPSSAVRGALDLVRYDVLSGTPFVLLSALDLVPEGAEHPLRVEDYAFSPDRSRLLLFTDSRRVWRTNSRGDFWLFELTSRSLRRLGGPDAPPSSLQFAKFAPDGARVAYVRQNDLWVEDVASGAVTRLTDTGTDDVVNGTFDWVYEEEFEIKDGFRWSPNGAHIAFWRIDKSGVGAYRIVDNLSTLYPRVTEIPYPKVGTTNPAAHVGVVAADGGATVWLDLPGDPRDDYVARMDWTPAGDVMVQRLDRRQQVDRVLRCDPRTGACREVFVDSDPAWVDYVDTVHWVDEGREFLWLSERDGWRHVWSVPADGGEPRCLTPGDYDVVELLAVEELSDSLWLIASPDDPSRRFLYRAPLSGGAAQRITPADAAPWNDYSIAPGTRYAIRTASSFTTPPIVDAVRLPDHESVRVLVDNARLRDNLAALELGAQRFFRVDVGQGVQIDGWQILPPRFDESKRWPVLIHVYGEPAAQTVLDRWGGGNHLWHLLLSQQGYVVMSFDNRGTPAPRGRAWRKIVHGKVGVLPPIDQAKALLAAEERFRWIDPERVGIWGWSGGGSMTLNALFRYPELYSAGIAVAFVADQRLYDTIYQERYMGLLTENPDGYRDGSPISRARDLEGDLLLVYGSGDDNTHYQNFERLVDELVAENKRFDALPYPNRTHGLVEGRNTRRHLYTSMTGWLRRHLPAGPRS